MTRCLPTLSPRYLGKLRSCCGSSSRAPRRQRWTPQPHRRPLARRTSLSAKDCVSLCSFTFSDGRRCRTPRIRNHPHFCFYHAQEEATTSPPAISALPWHVSSPPLSA